MGVIDAFVSAHNHHRRKCGTTQGASEIVWKGGIRLMTAITPTYAHAYQSSLLDEMHPCGSPFQNFVYLPAEARYPHFPKSRSTACERGNGFHGLCCVSPMEELVVTDGGNRGWLECCRSITRWKDLCHVWPSPSLLKTHLAFAGGQSTLQQTPPSSQVSLKHFSFLGPRGPTDRESYSCIFNDSKTTAASICLGDCSITC